MRFRVVEDGEFERLGNSQTIKTDARIIAATNRDLEKEVRRGKFRKDLWYRLDVFPLTLPPLRERTDDIPLPVDFMIRKFALKFINCLFIFCHKLIVFQLPSSQRQLKRKVLSVFSAPLR